MSLDINCTLDFMVIQIQQSSHAEDLELLSVGPLSSRFFLLDSIYNGLSVYFKYYFEWCKLS